METVLVVDDQMITRKILSTVLKNLGYEHIYEAEDGIEALSMAKKYKPDIVIMDIMMPNMNGMEATKKILKIYKDTQIIMISSVGHIGKIVESIKAGAKNYITKPFTKEKIEKALSYDYSEEWLTAEEKVKYQKYIKLQIDIEKEIYDKLILLSSDNNIDIGEYINRIINRSLRDEQNI